MRWFWLFIALLAVLTGVLYTQRVRSERAQQAALQAQTQSSTPSTSTRRSRERSNASTPELTQSTTDPETPVTMRSTPTQIVVIPEVQTPEQPVAEMDESLPESESRPGAQAEPSDERSQIADSQEFQPQTEPKSTFNPDALVTQFNELGKREQDQEPESIESALARAAEQTEQQGQLSADADEVQQQTQEAAAEEAPSFELRADGSFRIIDANVWVQGAGTNAEPYMLGWDALKSIENVYDPKKGKDKLPSWLEFLDGKIVSIEGNTLVPVVATTTRELLIMKNPWDGCCIGVPPTPYDAVEVVLNHDVDFGNSAVGFGSVQGTFYLDPYIVDGWVLGLYIVEDARYRSGEGVVFPEF